MCGIFGVVSKYNGGFFRDHVEMINSMLICGQLRGTHGTGMFDVFRDGSTDWVKIGSHAQDLLESKQYEDFIDNVTKKALAVVGHNRYATRGDHSTNNAHPFKYKHITLVHNGLITSTDVEKNGVKVDSHSFTKDLANAGDDWKELLRDTKGAFALVWHNTKDNTLYMYRNNDRPLSLYESDGQFLFASERGMVHWLGARKNLKMDYKEIKSEVLYAFRMDEESGKNGRILVEEPLPLKPYYYNTNYNHYTGPKVTGSSNVVPWTGKQFSPKELPHSKKVGDTVLFSLYDECSEAVGTSTIWKYKGVLEEDASSDNVEVVFLTKTKNSEWLDKALLVGTICGIMRDGTIQLKTRTVAEVESESLIKVEQVKYDEDEMLTLRDGARMSRYKFRKLTALRCLSCHDKITDEEALGCSYSERINGLYCPSCTDTIEAEIAAMPMYH